MSPAGALQALRQRLYHRWLERRLPRVAEITLNRKSIFTFPSTTGLMFILFLLLLWLLAVNYENNVVFAFGALLGAALIVSIFHGYANLAGLAVRIVAIESGFPGDRVRVDIEIRQSGKRHRDDIWVKFPDTLPERVVLHDGEASAVVSLFVRARRRGWLQTGRLTLESVYPLGLIRVWTHILLAGRGVVYPRPVAGAPRGSGTGGGDENRASERPGSEDFSDLKAYRQGEPVNRIAWKQVARGQGVYSKHFVDPVADPRWLDWQDYPGMDREARLSRLCHDLLAVSRSGRPFGLRLPGQESVLGQGDQHRDRLLKMLALFEVEKPA